MEELDRNEIYPIVEKLIFKSQEISSMMKQGQFIAAYEKLGGVIKVLAYLGTRTHPGVNPVVPENKTDNL